MSARPASGSHEGLAERSSDLHGDPSAQRKTTAQARRDAILAAMPKEDFDALAAALARLLLSAARVNGRAAAAPERTTEQEDISCAYSAPRSSSTSLGKS